MLDVVYHLRQHWIKKSKLTSMVDSKDAGKKTKARRRGL